MARTPRDVTDTELAILEVLWERGQATRRQLMDALYPGGGPAQYATIQKLLERLEGKG
ncbi:MAG: BlaI/MecI/CopY family transcriptional regulator, partial [Planctomycetes bacterium]|nr:BlaI/MecI/CopY family transcriptional regulator [Planctomycetota bacterium]